MPGPARRTSCSMRKEEKVSSARVVDGESEGRGLFTNLFGVPSTTPARPLPASARGRRRVFKGVTKDWRAVHAKPSGPFKDAGSRFRGARKSKRVTWGQWKHPASPPRECVSKVKSTPRKPRSARSGTDGVGSSGPSLLEIWGKEGVSAWDDDVRGENLHLSSILQDADMCSAASPSAAQRVPAASGRLATSSSLPSCWIADTGCGHDLLLSLIHI